MKKSVIAAALALGIGADIASAVQMNNASFDMFDPTGAPAGVDPTVTGSIDSSTWSVSSTTKFNGLLWTASGGTTWAPGTYDVNTSNTNPGIGPSGTVAGCGGGSAGCYEGIVVGPGQIMGHILFAWGVTFDIDVVNVWDIIDNGNGTVTFSSQDVELASPANESLDGIPGLSMIDGPFAQFNANFNFTTSAPPKAANDSKGTTVDTQVTIDLVANDSAADMTAVDPTCPPNQFCAVTPALVPPTVMNLPASPLPSGATISHNGDGTVLYTPPPGTALVDTFQYSITDNATPARTSALATVTITVSAAANTPPVANNVDFSTPEDISLDIAVTDTDDNGIPVATDEDGDSITYANFDAVSTKGGAVTADNTNTVLTYTPAKDFNGTDTFTFIVNDGTDNSTAGTVTINVAAVNDPLVCTDVNETAIKNIALDINVADKLLATCVDPDAEDTITLDSTTQPTQQGSMLSFDGNNTLTYTPAADFVGADTFTYTATDGTAFDTRTVFIDVLDRVFGNFTMIDPSIATIGGTNDVVAQWDKSLCNDVADPVNKCPMTIASDSLELFKGFPWFAHDIRIFDTGNYTFDTIEGPPLNLTVGPGQTGAHILFDWNITKNIDVVLVWDNDGVFEKTAEFDGLHTGPAGPPPALDCNYELVSRDADGDGVPGAKMVDGPFIGFQANFNLNFTRNCGVGVTGPNPVSTIKSPSLGGTGGCNIAGKNISPLQRSEWGLLAGLLAMLGFSLRKRRKLR